VVHAVERVVKPAANFLVHLTKPSAYSLMQENACFMRLGARSESVFDSQLKRFLLVAELAVPRSFLAMSTPPVSAAEAIRWAIYCCITAWQMRSSSGA
jgi:hypothetical protein